MSHPYRQQPPRAFWSRAVSRGFDGGQTVVSGHPLIQLGDKVVSAGSCFASNIVPYLDRAGLTYLRTEQPHASFCAAEAEHLGYANFSATYGNIYTVRQLRQLLQRATGAWWPQQDRWHIGPWVIDPFRPGLRYAARRDDEFDVLTRQHLASVKRAFSSADVFVLTLGLTEAWVAKADGTVYPAAPGTIRGTTENIVCGSFDWEKHAFHNFTAAEVSEDLNAFICDLRVINPSVRIILTVSPVPLVATATEGHVLIASTYSKSVLRVAAQQAIESHQDVAYFPAYEIVTGPQAPDSFFEADRREVSKAAVDAVMSALLSHCEVSGEGVPIEAGARVSNALSNLVSTAECEEMMAESPWKM